jgi:hypothetical protein
VSNGASAADSPGLTFGEVTRRWITPRRVAVGVLLVLTLFAAYSCQRSQVRISQTRAIQTARRQVDFVPQQTQIRLLRQGLNSHPYWAISLSIPNGSGGYSQLTVVRVDANTGKVAAITKQLPGRTSP